MNDLKEERDMKRSIFLATLCASMLLMAAATVQAQSCRDPWVTAALRAIGKGGPADTGNSGLCNIDRYHAGHWNNHGELNDLVKQSFLCSDPWIGEIYAEASMGYSRPNGSGAWGDCNPQNYGGGHWSSYDDLKNKVYAYKHPAPAPTPAPRQVAALGSPVVVNNDGGWCINAAGDHLVMRPCTGGASQMVTIDNRIRINGLCAQADSRNEGAEIHLRPCSGNDALQNFSWWSGGRIGHNTGYVLAAAGHYFGFDRPLCLWKDEGRTDQHWRKGNMVYYKPGELFPSSVQRVYAPGRNGFAGVVASGGGNLISSDGAGVVASGGGNLLSSDGAGIVASGGGNLVASGGGN